MVEILSAVEPHAGKTVGDFFGVDLVQRATLPASEVRCIYTHSRRTVPGRRRNSYQTMDDRAGKREGGLRFDVEDVNRQRRHQSIATQRWLS
jgi:hypothetical protein